MTEHEQQCAERVEIAQDVINHLTSRKLQVCHGHIWRGKVFNKLELLPADSDVQDFLKNVPSDEEPCRVCAKGALLLAHIERYDKVKVGEVRYINTVGLAEAERLADILSYFPPRMLQELETAFERQLYNWNPDISQCDFDILVNHYSDFTAKNIEAGSTEYLIHLMQLIIDNKGEKLIL